MAAVSFVGYHLPDTNTHAHNNYTNKDKRRDKQLFVTWSWHSPAFVKSDLSAAVCFNRLFIISEDPIIPIIINMLNNIFILLSMSNTTWLDNRLSANLRQQLQQLTRENYELLRAVNIGEVLESSVAARLQYLFDSHTLQRILFLRHGNTSKAANDSIAADLDRELSEKGHSQCLAARTKWFHAFSPLMQNKYAIVSSAQVERTFSFCTITLSRNVCHERMRAENHANASFNTWQL